MLVGANEGNLQLPGLHEPSIPSSASQALGPALEEIDDSGFDFHQEDVDRSGFHNFPVWMWEDGRFPIFLRNKRGLEQEGQQVFKRRKIQRFKRPAKDEGAPEQSFKKVKIAK